MSARWTTCGCGRKNLFGGEIRIGRLLHRKIPGFGHVVCGGLTTSALSFDSVCGRVATITLLVGLHEGTLSKRALWVHGLNGLLGCRFAGLLAGRCRLVTFAFLEHCGEIFVQF